MSHYLVVGPDASVKAFEDLDHANSEARFNGSRIIGPDGSAVPVKQKPGREPKVVAPPVDVQKMIDAQAKEIAALKALVADVLAAVKAKSAAPGQ